MENNIWKTLYDRAKAVQCERRLSPLMEVGSVGAAIQTDKGNIYTGICIDTACGMGMCAERNAIANMLTCGENKITRVVAVMSDGSSGTPCGVCREFMMQLGEDSKDIEILLSLEPLKTVKLGEQLPDWWGKAYIKDTISPHELHILNGDHALQLWEKCNFSGESLVWKETYLEGPLPDTDDLHIFRNARAEYLSGFVELSGMSLEKIYRHLQKMDDILLNLPDTAAITLWLDSCMFDQTILMRILYLLNRKQAADLKIFLYCCDGNCLSAEDFQHGISGKVQLSKDDIVLGAKAWEAFVRQDADELFLSAQNGNFEHLLALQKALQRCAEEVPDTNGLTRTQRQILQIVSGKSCSFMEIFKGLDAFEEYPFLGDTACQRLLDDLQKKGLLEVSPDNRYHLRSIL